MFRVFSFSALYFLSSLVYAQDGEISSEPAFEINESKEEIDKDPFGEFSAPEDVAPEDPNETTADIPIELNTDTSSDNVEENAETNTASAEDETVLVRERVEPESSGNGTADNLVEVRSNRTIFLPYKQRQNPWGFSVSFGGEFLYFPNLVSQFDEATYEDMFGTSLQMATSIELGPKYNMTWGSLGMTFGFAQLKISDDRLDGVEAGLSLSRYSGTLTYYLDTISTEAYVIPYIGAGVWQADYEETSDEYPGEKEKYTTEVGYHWRAGGLFSLSWLEPNTALRSRRSVGLQEAFLNVYVSSTYMAESEPDPDLESEYDIGASVLLEF